MSDLRLVPSLDLTSLFSPNLALNGTLGPNLDFAGVLDIDLDFDGVFDLDLDLGILLDLDLDLDTARVLRLADKSKSLSALDPNLSLHGTLNIDSLLMLRLLTGEDKSATLLSGDNSWATTSSFGRSAKVTLMEPSCREPGLSGVLLLLLLLSFLSGADLLPELLC